MGSCFPLLLLPSSPASSSRQCLGRGSKQSGRSRTSSSPGLSLRVPLSGTACSERAQPFRAPRASLGPKLYGAVAGGAGQAIARVPGADSPCVPGARVCPEPVRLAPGSRRSRQGWQRSARSGMPGRAEQGLSLPRLSVPPRSGHAGLTRAVSDFVPGTFKINRMRRQHKQAAAMLRRRRRKGGAGLERLTWEGGTALPCATGIFAGLGHIPWPSGARWGARTCFTWGRWSGQRGRGVGGERLKLAGSSEQFWCRPLACP